MANPTISEANDALEDLSRDPKAQALARWREDQLKLYRVELATAERRGQEDGLRSARETLRALCVALGVELTKEREAQVDGATLDQIDRIRDALVQSRSWPD